MLTRAELHRLYEINISEYVFSYKDKPSIRERKSAMLIESKMNISLKRFPSVTIPKHKHTPDFASVESFVVLEVKTTESLKNGFNNAFKRAKAQLRELKDELYKIVFIEIIGVSEKEINFEVKSTILERAGYHGVKYFIILCNKKVILERLP